MKKVLRSAREEVFSPEILGYASGIAATPLSKQPSPRGHPPRQAHRQLSCRSPPTADCSENTTRFLRLTTLVVRMIISRSLQFSPKYHAQQHSMLPQQQARLLRFLSHLLSPSFFPCNACAIVSFLISLLLSLFRFSPCVSLTRVLSFLPFRCYLPLLREFVLDHLSFFHFCFALVSSLPLSPPLSV